MRILYIECGMGAAGDMLTSALAELFDDEEKILRELNETGIPEIEYRLEKKEKNGFKGSHIFAVSEGKETDDYIHQQRSLKEIKQIVNECTGISETVKNDVMNIYKLIAQAECEVHKVSADDIHFYEIGALDSIADIVGAAYLIDKLKIDRIICSPIHVGSGTIKCSHGILPVPTPATAVILKDIPIYSREDVSGELCTPTGAAVLKYYAEMFGEMPKMKIIKTAYGFGTKDFKNPSFVKMLMGEAEDN